MKVLTFAILFFVVVGMAAWSGGKAEAASKERGEYIAAKGRIISPKEIYEDAYVGDIDFEYPEPEGSFGVRFYSGHRQVSTTGQEEVILIGIQGRRLTHEDYPPVNQAFVIDKSGSMYQKDKMEWVKQSFEVFMDSVREKDYVSLIVFDETPRVVIPSTQMSGEKIRKRFRDAVNAIRPGGGSNLTSALQLAYKEVLSNFRKGYVNQVLFLTDGIGEKEEMYRMAETYRPLGVQVTAIGMGEDCDIGFLDALADRGGGSSRFLASRETIEEMFGREFSRMVVPVARDVELELYLTQNLEDFRTWGYHAEIEGQWDSFRNQRADKPPIPRGIAVDSHDDTYITDAANNRVQRYGRNGNLITQWGRSGIRNWAESGASEEEGRFYQPAGIAVASDGNVYVVDSGNNRIQKFDSHGNFLIQWGSPGIGSGNFRNPTEVAVDAKGCVYVADSGNNRIQKFDGNGKLLTKWGGIGSEKGQFSNPEGVTVDQYSNVYVADTGNRRVQIFESDGTFITTLEGDGAREGAFHPSGVAVDLDGNIYVADSQQGLIKKYDIEKNFLTQWGSYGIKEEAFSNLSAVAVDSGGNVYAAEAGRNSIQEFDKGGSYMMKQPIRFSLPVVNLGDYETIVIQARIPPQETEGIRSIARLQVSYTDMDDKRIEMEPIELRVDFVSESNPVDGISNALVLRASTMLRYSQALKRIGAEYEAGQTRRALDLTNEIKKELLNVRDRLGENYFTKELSILERYIALMGEEANLNTTETRLLLEDREIAPVSADRGLLDHLGNLFKEITLDLQARQGGNLALLGFSFPDNRSAKLLDLLEETAGSALFELSDFTVLERRRIDSVLKEQELSVTDLMDTNRAIDVGRLLSAHYILTGSVIEMSRSVVIFCRVINTETAAIESVSQVFVPRNAEVNGLL